MRAVYLLFLVAIAVYHAQAYDCRPLVNGTYYDFTSLIAKNGSYVVEGVINGTTYVFQIQICGVVSPQPYKACTVPSPVNQLTTDHSVCYSLGDDLVWAWDPNPYNDGVRLSLYHGTYLNHITARNLVLYFICNDVFVPIFFEHERIAVDPNDMLEVGAQYHFSIKTPLACASSVSSVVTTN